MKYLAIAAVCLALGAGLVSAADPVTLEGKVMCAKCALKEEGQKKCQNVLSVEDDGKQSFYYMAKNDVNAEFGEVCMATPTVRVTGKVTEKDGKRWIDATKIEPLDGHDGPKHG